MSGLKLGGRLGFSVLKALSYEPSKALVHLEREASGTSKLATDFGKDVWGHMTGRTVIDYGSGEGHEAVAAALHGAKKVYGLEIQADRLEIARNLAKQNGVEHICSFLDPQQQKDEIKSLYGTADCVFTLDSFEHFSDPEETVAEMSRLLRPGGCLLVNFGPPWNHPYGCHVRYITPVPWVHLLFEEQTIMAVRALYRGDGAKRFEEVSGGLNQMTVGRFLILVESSNFQVEKLRLHPIRRCGFLVNIRLLREYCTSAVECVLLKSGG